jgi:hypothetical protein
VTATITLAWVLALIVLFSVRSALPSDVRWWVWTCFCGVMMGLFGLWYVPFLKRRRARIAAERAASVDPQGTRPEASEPQTSGSPAPDAQLSEAAPGYVSRDNGSNTVSSTETPGKSTRS